MKELRIGLFGAGTVGRGLIEMLRTQAEILTARTGASFRVDSVCDRSFARKKDALAGIQAGDDPAAILEDPKIEVVVELLGGLEPARTIVLRALQAGKHVVTANKALLATHGPEIYRAAAAAGREIAFEAAVAGALPVIRSLRRGLVANEIRGLYGILNGTCNFIITQMQATDLDYDAALKLAQERGFAEADPSFDVDGRDAAQKLAILAGLAFDTTITEEQIGVQGIRHVRRVDLLLADRMGWEIRLLATARRQEDGSLLLRVHPAMIPKEHILSSVTQERNAVFFDTSHSGPSLIMGLGAGPYPTASAVISDLVSLAARDPKRPELYLPSGAMARVAQTGAYRNYLRVQTLDRPGVLADVARILADRGISIATVQQNEGREPVDVVILTHRAPEASMAEALKIIDGLPFVQLPTVHLRIEDLAF